MENTAIAEKPRWRYRYDNFKRTYALLQEACNKQQQGELEQLAKEGMIHRFELCMELACQTIQDYMEAQGFIFHQVFPSHVIKEAYTAKLIDNIEDWMDALDARNKMSHTYNFEVFEQVIEQISERYIHCFGQLYEMLGMEAIESEERASSTSSKNIKKSI